MWLPEGCKGRSFRHVQCNPAFASEAGSPLSKLSFHAYVDAIHYSRAAAMLPQPAPGLGQSGNYVASSLAAVHQTAAIGAAHAHRYL